MKIDFFTQEDIEEDPLIEGKFREEEEILKIRHDMPLNAKALVLRHEIGHLKYPVEDPLEVEMSNEEAAVKSLFAELCANYYSLKVAPIGPLNRDIRDKIRADKEWVKDFWELSDKEVSRIDRIARERVGYTGKEIKGPSYVTRYLISRESRD